MDLIKKEPKTEERTSNLLFSRFEFPEPARNQQRNRKKKIKRVLTRDGDPWSKMELKASGVKIKDDAALKKVTADRRLRQKKKSEQFWQKQKNKVREDLEKRQQKRMENIRMKTDQKRKRKHKQLEKRGRVVIK